MSRGELIKKINNFFDQSPFDDREIKMWQGKMVKMNEADLSELYNLLQEKLKILTDSNQLMVNIAEEVVKEDEKEMDELPKKVNFIDLPIAVVSAILRTDLVKYLKAKNADLVVLLDQYFNEAYGNDEDVILEFDMLVKAIVANNEFLDGKRKITVGGWLKLYNQFNENDRRKNIDRVNFVNQNNEANKLSQEDRGYLLNLLKLYDYLLDPESVLTTLNKEEYKAAVVAPRKIDRGNLSQREKQIIDLRKMAGSYSAGSFERKAVEEEIRKLESLK